MWAHRISKAILQQVSLLTSIGYMSRPMCVFLTWRLPGALLPCVVAVSQWWLPWSSCFPVHYPHPCVMTSLGNNWEGQRDRETGTGNTFKNNDKEYVDN